MDKRIYAIIKRTVAGLPPNKRREVYLRLRQGLPESVHPILEEAIETVEAELSGNWLIRWAKRRLDFDTKTVEGRLKLYDRACGLVTIGVLWTIFKYRFGWSDYFKQGLLNIDSWERFLRDHGPATLLLAVVMGVYFLSRTCVKTEMAIARKLFSPARMPKDWAKVTGNRQIVLMITVYMAEYLVIACFTNDVRVVAGGFAVIYVVSYFNQFLTRRNFANYFADPLLLPDQDDPHRAFILRRRRVAEDYLFRKPHLWKEAAVVFGSTLALVIAAIGEMRGSNILVAAAYAVLIITLVGNESLVEIWRVVRRRLLAAIDEDEYITDLQRIGGG